MKTASAMKTQVYPPFPALKNLIQYVSSFSIDFKEHDNLNPIHFFTPTHTQFIVFNLDDLVRQKETTEKKFSELKRSLIIGAKITPHYLDLGKKHTIFIAHFWPGVLHRLLKAHMSETALQPIDAELIFGNEINFLIEQLAEEPSDHMRNYLIQNFLIQKLKNIGSDNVVDLTIRLATKENGNISIKDLADFSCMSVRQFERKVNERIGMSPKLYSKLVRFSHATTLKERNPKLSWFEIAHLCGYFDQMHLIRDFKMFTDDNPGAFTARIESSTKFKSLDDYFLLTQTGG